MSRRDALCGVFAAIAFPTTTLIAQAEERSGADVVAAVAGKTKILFPEASSSSVKGLANNGYTASLVKSKEFPEGVSYFHDGKRGVSINPPESYSHGEPAAVSSTGIVVGRFHTPKEKGDSPVAAFAFNAHSEKLALLPVPQPGMVALATDVSEDGAVIVGTCGAVPCVWTSIGEDAWKIQLLPGAGGKLVSGSDVQVSASGNRLVSTVQTGEGKSQLTQWIRTGEGQWFAFVCDCPEVLHATGINDEGRISGSVSRSEDEKTSSVAAMFDPQLGFREIGGLEGHDHSVAMGINQVGLMVVSSRRTGNGGEARVSLADGRKNTPIEFAGEQVSDFQGCCLNDRGQVAGALKNRTDKEGGAHAYIWTPQQ
jgi:uncharacterized membrane protein